MKFKKYFPFLFVICLAFVLAIFGSQSAFRFAFVQAQLTDTSLEEQLDRRVESFFRDLEQSTVQSNTAFEELFRDGSTSSRTTSEAVENMSKKFAELNSSEIGRLHSAEKIGTKTVGKDVILLKYLSKHDNAPVVWTFTFYRPPRIGSPSMTSMSNTNWSVILVRFDTNLEGI